MEQQATQKEMKYALRTQRKIHTGRNRCVCESHEIRIARLQAFPSENGFLVVHILFD